MRDEGEARAVCRTALPAVPVAPVRMIDVIAVWVVVVVDGGGGEVVVVVVVRGCCSDGTIYASSSWSSLDAEERPTVGEQSRRRDVRSHRQRARRPSPGAVIARHPGASVRRRSRPQVSL
jgi:hypothetical protein